MAAVFERDGVHFLYPENWRLEESPLDEGWAVALQSPETAFLMLHVYPNRPPVQEVLDASLAALREDYPDLEATPAVEQLDGRRAKGHDINFFALDLTNSCWIRSFRAAHCTVLVLCQTNDLELDYFEPVLRAIRCSLRVSDE